MSRGEERCGSNAWCRACPWSRERSWPSPSHPPPPKILPGPAGTLILGGETEWGFLDPHIDASGATHRVNYQLFEGLFWRDYTRPNDGRPPPIIPQLATRYEVSDDGLEYTVHLREGVKFHDGTPFNAEAVIFNVRRVWDEDFEYFYDRTGSLRAAVWRDLEAVEAIDDRTVRFTLEKPFAFFIDQLAEPTGVGIPVYMSPASIMKWGNEEVEQHPVGTGPFPVRGARARPADRLRAQPGLLESAVSLSRPHHLAAHSRALHPASMRFSAARSTSSPPFLRIPSST